MDRKDIESSVTRVVEDLNQKILNMENAAANADSIKAVEVKNKAVEILDRVSKKFVQTAKDVRNAQEFRDGVVFVMTKSKELYETTMAKIEELSKKPVPVKTADKVEETVKEEPVKEEPEKAPEVKKTTVDIGSLFDNVKTNTNTNVTVEKTEVNTKTETARKDTPELAEKGLAVLKEWLSPKGDD